MRRDFFKMIIAGLSWLLFGKVPAAPVVNWWNMVVRINDEGKVVHTWRARVSGDQRLAPYPKMPARPDGMLRSNICVSFFPEKNYTEILIIDCQV